MALSRKLWEWVSVCVGFFRPTRHSTDHFGNGLSRQNAHNNGTVTLTFTENPSIKNKTQKQTKSNIVKTRHYNCAYVRLMTVIL